MKVLGNHGRRQVVVIVVGLGLIVLSYKLVSSPEFFHVSVGQSIWLALSAAFLAVAWNIIGGHWVRAARRSASDARKLRAAVESATSGTGFRAWARRISSSLPEYLALFQVLWGVPMAALGLRLNFVEGSLTLSWAIWCVFISSIGALVVGALTWYTAFKPLILGRREEREKSGHHEDPSSTQ